MERLDIKGTDIPLYQDAESFDTFDVNPLSEGLSHLRETSFNFLNRLQQELTDMAVFNFKGKDFKPIFPNRYDMDTPVYATSIRYNFIRDQRRNFKNSSFIKKYISIYDTAKNPKLFTHTMMLFINGKMYDSVKVFCDDDITYIVLPQKTLVNSGLPLSHIQEIITNNYDCTIIFSRNCAYGVYETNRNVLTKYQYNLSLDRFNIANNLGTETKYLAFVNDNDLLYESVIVDTVNSKNALRFTTENAAVFDNRYIHINIFGFRNLLDEVIIPAGSKWFSIGKQNMPIPVENMLIFSEENGKREYAHGISVKRYYPNYYEVVGNTSNKELSILVFYSQDNDPDDPYTYKDVFQLYKNTMNITLDNYVNNTVNSYVRNYQQEDRPFSTRDFTESEYDPHHIQYRIERMRQRIKDDPSTLYDYLEHQLNQYDSYYVDCSKIDLPSRERMDNFDDITDTAQRKEFTEPMYLFIFRRYYNSTRRYYRFFIDGVHYYSQNVYMDTNFEYHYFPKRLLNTTSMIEVEKFDSYDHQEKISLGGINSSTQVTIPSEYNVINSGYIFLIDSSGAIVSPNHFDIVYKSNRVDITTNSREYNILPRTFSIVPRNESIINSEVTLYMKSYFYTEFNKINSVEDIMSGYVFEANIDNRAENIRVFKNGRLIPKEGYMAFMSNKMDGKNNITPLTNNAIGDTFVLDYTPYMYKLVHEQDTIDEIGLLDLKGSIDMPFDLKWYDVYLNGRKLNRNNVDIITPTIVFIKNVKSRKNLKILKKNRNTEYFTFDTDNKKTPLDRIWELDISFQEELKKRPTLDDIETNIIGDLKDAVTIEMNTLISQFFANLDIINPDIKQLTENDKSSFSNLFVGDILSLDANLHGDTPLIID